MVIGISVKATNMISIILNIKLISINFMQLMNPHPHPKGLNNKITDMETHPK
jgi:hypothetical protein